MGDRTMETPTIGQYHNAGQDALNEIIRARFTLNFKPFHSAHEGYAVLLEEVEELKRHVWTNQRKRDYAEMQKEAIQVAAMALAFAVECASLAQEGTLG